MLTFKAKLECSECEAAIDVDVGLSRDESSIVNGLYVVSYEVRDLPDGWQHGKGDWNDFCPDCRARGF